MSKGQNDGAKVTSVFVKSRAKRVHFGVEMVQKSDVGFGNFRPVGWVVRIISTAILAAFLISNVAVATDPTINSHGKLVYNDGGNTIVIDSADFGNAVAIAENYAITADATVLNNAKTYADEKDAVITTNVTNATNRIATLEGTVGDSTAGLVKTINDLNAQIALLENQINTMETSFVSMALTEGNIITMGNYQWMVCDQLDDNVVCIVACGTKNNGMINSHGVWPGYVANGNQNSTEEWCYKDIHSLYPGSELANFYNAFSAAEAPGGVDATTGIYSNTAAKNGLYLLSHTKAVAGSYAVAFKTVSSSGTRFGSTIGYSWLGNPSRTDGAYLYTNTGLGSCGTGSGTGIYQSSDLILAPAYNLDLSKIKISGSIVSLRE